MDNNVFKMLGLLSLKKFLFVFIKFILKILKVGDFFVFDGILVEKVE